jgi:DNA invertase Pin-like site-specific DNA recombinase
MKTSRAPKDPSSTRAITYTRVSTDRQAGSGLSLDDQRQRCRAAIESRSWARTAELTDAGLSAKDMRTRPALLRGLEMLDAGEADALVVAEMSRLVRSLVDLAEILDRSKAGGWAVVILNVDVDTSTATGRMVLNIIGAVAQWESEMIGERVTMAHRERKARGLRPGQAPELPDAIRHRIATERAAGDTLTTIADRLNQEDIPTARAGRWHPATIRHVCRSVELDREVAMIQAQP